MVIRVQKMFFAQIIDEVDQLCTIYNKTTTNEDEKRKLREILAGKEKELLKMVSDCNLCLKKIASLVQPAQPPSKGLYNVYNI